MSNTRKDQHRKDEEETGSTTTPKATAAFSSQIQQEQSQSIDKTIDETREHIRRATDEVRKDIPRYTQAVDQYQEQTIQMAREVADDFLESQKKIINSFQLAWVPLIQRTYSVFWNYCLSPRWTTDIYARVTGNIADNTVATTKLVNNNVFSTLDAFKTSIQNTRDTRGSFKNRC